MPQQFQPVSFRTRQSVLVPVNHSRGIFLQLPRADKSPPRLPFARSRHGVLLRVSIKRSRPDPAPHAHRQSIPESPPLRVCTRYSRQRRPGIRPPLFYRNQIVRTRGVILLLHRRRNFVIRLGQHSLERRVRRVVAKSAKWKNLGHVLSEILNICRFQFTRTTRQTLPP